MGHTPPPDPPAAPDETLVPVVTFLSGRRRGDTQRLTGEYLRIGTFPGAEIRLSTGPGEVPPEEYGLVRQQGGLYELDVAPGKEVFVNGDPVDRRVLASGDVLEIGRGGPLLRFRLFESARGHKRVSEALNDCLDSSQGIGVVGRASFLARAVPRELLTQTSWLVRVGAFATLAVLLAAIVGLAWRGVVLERRLAEERGRVSGLAELLAGQSGENPRTPVELGQALDEVQTTLSETARRVRALEGQSAATRLVIAAATRSTVFIQGSWGFVDPRTGQPLRVVVGPDGTPVRGPGGEPLVTTDTSQPMLEALFTGTGFAVGGPGYLLTNRHVAEPWRFDEAAVRVAAQGWTPVMRRLVAYLPDQAEPLTLQLVATSDSADLAVLRSATPGRGFPVLALSDDRPRPGDEVVVLGYPLGIRGLMVRADQRVL
ncbi:MAG: trypsin-like peptidase domain-containing protein, partial [Gemmatimonadota bacterium]|nr:trypsin-like peptidase domain-containing protein [Gemmatimonadota bacterium]